MIRFIKTLIHDFLFDWWWLKTIKEDKEFRKNHSIVLEYLFVIMQWVLWCGGLLGIIAFTQLFLYVLLSNSNVSVTIKMLGTNLIIAIYQWVYSFLVWYGQNPHRDTIFGVNDKWV